jgi:hypothetical protein
MSARRIDPWVVAVCVASIAQTALFASVYPQQRFDPDLIAYLTYFRNWTAGDATLHGIPYFTHPKALLVFALGPLGNASAALAVTAVASAALAGLVYLLARDAFGRGTGLMISACLLLDPSKALLTLKSGADLFVACFLFAAIHLTRGRRVVAAAVCLLLGALVKPVIVPCAACFLAIEGGGRRRWIAALLPFAAIPLIALANQALLGSVHGTDRFFEEFAALRGEDGIGAQSVVHFALWTQLVKTRFIATAAWGLLGLVLWTAADRRRITDPLLLMPLLFLSGYVLLGFTARFMPFFRFFWALEVWFLMFVVFGAVETARRVAAGQRWVERTAVAIVLVLLADAYVVRQIDYRRDFALPFERSMAFARTAEQRLRRDWSAEQTVVVPLALLPYMMWAFPGPERARHVAIAERVALQHTPVEPDWIVYMPLIYASAAARDALPQVIRAGGYEMRETDGESALLARSGIGQLAAGDASAQGKEGEGVP